MLLPVSEFIKNSGLDSDFNQNFVAILKLLSKALSEKHEEMNIRISSSASELQKELHISEVETKLSAQIDRCQMLENKIFSMEKQLCALKYSPQNNNEVNESPLKKHKNENDKNELSKEADSTNQDLVARHNVAMAELEELKRISKIHVDELKSLQIENKALLEDVESKKDQVIINIFIKKTKCT